MSLDQPPPASAAARQLGRGLRLVLLIACLGLLVWLLDRHLVFGSRYQAAIDNFFKPHPSFRLTQPDSLWLSLDQTGRRHFRAGREAVRFSLRPPRSFHSVTLRLKVKTTDLPILALSAAPRAAATSQAVVFWHSPFEELDWPRLEAGDWRLLQRPVSDQPPLASLAEFFGLAGQRQDVASVLISPAIGRPLPLAVNPDLTGINYLLLPQPRFPAARDQASLEASFNLADLATTEGSFSFTLLAPGLALERPSLELIELSASFEGEALTPTKLSRVVARWLRQLRERRGP